jgi:hypothetical protein
MVCNSIAEMSTKENYGYEGSHCISTEFGSTWTLVNDQ